MASLRSVDYESAFPDLASRFSAARLAALRACAPDAPTDAGERELLARALAKDPKAVQKAVFDNALRLGRGFRRFYGRTLSLAELPRLLPLLGLACAEGVFRGVEDDAGVLLVRRGCALRELGAGACDVYNEALHGLVLGLTDGLYHTRHSSLGHGADTCIDAFHPEGSALRYGEISAEVRSGLEQVARLVRTFDASLSVEFLGINDGALHYRMTQGPDAQLSARAQVERHVRKRFPHLSVHEVSPRPVMAG